MYRVAFFKGLTALVWANVEDKVKGSCRGWGSVGSEGMAKHLYWRRHISAACVFSSIALRAWCTAMKVYFDAVVGRRVFIPTAWTVKPHYRRARAALPGAVRKWIPVKCIRSRDVFSGAKRRNFFFFFRHRFRRRQRQLHESRGV